MFFTFFYFTICLPEGFAASTLVKTPEGYAKIEDLHNGDTVICYDSHKNYTSSVITNISKMHIDHYVVITLSNEKIYTTLDQPFYDSSKNRWIATSSLKTGDTFSGSIIKVELINEPIDVYLISILEHHNFFITQTEICVHNFFPPVVLALSIAFGSSGLEIAGISCGFAGLGAFLGYKWRQKHKQSQFIIEPIQFSIAHESHEIHNLNDAQAPGMPTENDGFYPPKKWDGKKKKHPINGKVGWPDKKGKIWVPTGNGPIAHGGPHWDVQHPNGRDYDNVYPGGKIRPGK